MYRWLVFIHILGVAGFLLAHGVSTFVAIRIRGIREREKLQGLLELSGISIPFFYASLLLLLVGGIWAAFEGSLWSFGWIRWSLGILIVTMLAMYAIALPYYGGLRKKVQMRSSGNPVVSDEELDALLSSPRGLIVSAIGFIGLIAILYLMVMKPF